MSTVDTDTLPVYKAGEAPEHLRTATQLKADRLKVADGQEPVAWLRMYLRGSGWGEFALYDPAGAVKMRPLSAEQQRAKEARRTCPECGTVCGYIVHRQCQECAEQERRERLDLQRRTCVWCQRVSVAPHPIAETRWGRRGECVPCWVRRAIRLQLEAEQHAVWRRTCPGRDCTKVTATDEEIAAVRADEQRWWSPKWCPPCEERDTRERAEREQQQREAEQKAEENRRQEVQDLENWATAALADPKVVILDTETTGLEDDARIVEISIITASGEVLLDTLVNPGSPIPAEASDIHGITDAMVATAPSFGEILDRLTTVLDGRRCLIYHQPYDFGRLHWELTGHYRTAGHDNPEASAGAWLEAMTLEDVMIPYSDWVGDWNDYWGNNTWQPLNGGHRALGDCRAVIECLREMAGQGTVHQPAGTLRS